MKKGVCGYLSCRAGLLCAIVLGVAAPPAVLAGEQPLWELGLGVGGLVLPHYRGAKNVTGYALPFPFVQYHGERLQVDEEGLRGMFYRSERFEADISFAGGVPVSGESDTGRDGMPALDPTVEVGMSLDVNLRRARRHVLWLKMPVRAALAVDRKHVEHVGWVFSPYVEYRSLNGTPGGPWSVALSAGPLFADSRYHDYFYSVAPAHVRPGRAEYDAAAGYAGSRITLAVHKRVGGYWIGAFARVDSLRGAVFEDSPLVEQQFYFATGLAVARIFARAKRGVLPGE